MCRSLDRFHQPHPLPWRDLVETAGAGSMLAVTSGGLAPLLLLWPLA